MKRPSILSLCLGLLVLFCLQNACSAVNPGRGITQRITQTFRDLATNLPNYTGRRFTMPGEHRVPGLPCVPELGVVSTDDGGNDVIGVVRECEPESNNFWSN